QYLRHYIPSTTQQAPTSTLFPYTTLFRSKETGGKYKAEEWIRNSQLIYTIIRTAKKVSKPGKRTIKASEKIVAADDEIPHEDVRSEEHTSELQSRFDLVCRLLLEKKNKHC